MSEETGSNDVMWEGLFTDLEHPVHRYTRRQRAIWKHVPGHPRCKMCTVPLRGAASSMLTFTKKAPAKGNPFFCNACEVWVEEHPGGTETDMTLLFADVRGSTTLAEGMEPAKFAQLMRDFYKAANAVLVKKDAWMQKPVGDEIVAMFLPIFAPNHAGTAIESAGELLGALGELTGRSGLEVGGGVHSGVTYIGTVGVEGTDAYDMTVLGDVPNVTSRLAPAAGAGEMLINDGTHELSGFDLTDLEHRTLNLKGREAPLGVRVMATVGAAVS